MSSVRRARASILAGPGRVDTAEIEFGPPRPGEVVVAIAAAGVCHTDLWLADSPDGWGRGFPLVLGHEGSGVVEEIGEGVTHLRVGDHVAIGCRAPCGLCTECRDGRPRRCRASGLRGPEMRLRGGGEVRAALGVGLLAERVPVDARAVVALPPEVPLVPAGILGCAVSTGVGAVLNTAGVQPGDSVAVVGCGGVGLSAIQGARIAHAYPRIAIDVEPRKLSWALGLGATHTVDASQEDAVEAVRRITGGDGVDAAFEAVGSGPCLRDCVRMLAYGGTAVEIGVPPPGEVATLDLAGPQGLFARTGTLTVTHGGDTIPQQDLPTFVRLFLEGALDLEGMVTHRVPIGRVVEGFDNLRSGTSIRTVAVLEGVG